MRIFRLVAALFALPLTSSAQTQASYTAQIRAASPDISLNFNEASGNFVDSVTGAAFTPSGGGTLLYRQASLIPGRVSASFSFNERLTAPNNTLGNYDWSQPWWAIVRMNATTERNSSWSTRIELFSKGSVNANVDNTDGTSLGYVGYLHWNGANTLACLNMSSGVNAGSGSGIGNCSSIDVQDATTYTIIFTYDGSGTAAGINIYIEGQRENAPHLTTNGAPTAASMATPSSPLVINGDAANTIAFEGGNVHTNNPTIIEAFAIGKGTLAQTTIQGLAALGNYWKQILPMPPATPQNVIFDEDGCQDTDNLYAMAEVIKLHKLGYFKLLLVNNTEQTDLGPTIYQQMLDQAGLHHVPVSSSQGTWTVASFINLTASNVCSTATIGGYNATYPTRAQRISDVVGYRTALANTPNGSVKIIIGGAMRGVYDLLNSTADSISPLSGAALFTAKVASIHIQSGMGPTADNNLGEDVTGASYVLAHAGVPIYLYSTVALGNTGPGVDTTRPAHDPLTVAAELSNSLSRASYDSWPVLGALDQNLFWAIGTPGTVTLIGTSGGSTFSTATNSQHYEVAPNATYENNLTLSTWLLNSLILPNPAPSRTMGAVSAAPFVPPPPARTQYNL